MYMYNPQNTHHPHTLHMAMYMCTRQSFVQVYQRQYYYIYNHFWQYQQQQQLQYSSAHINTQCFGIIFLWTDSNNKPSASHSLDRLSSIWVSVNNFMLDRTASSSTMYFSVSFWMDLLLQYRMGRSTRSRQGVLASLGILQYTHTTTEEDRERLKRLDGNVCSCPSYIVTINPPKRH